jgi:hypothetical protein
VDDAEDEWRSAQADLDALQSHNARLLMIVGPILLGAGIVTLTLGVEFRLERIAVVGPAIGWFGIFATFGGAVTTLIHWIRR